MAFPEQYTDVIGPTTIKRETLSRGELSTARALGIDLESKIGVSSSISSENMVIPRFIEAWRNEKCAPDLLPYEEHLVEELQQALSDISKNKILKEDETGVTDLSLLRYNWLLKSYFRIRLHKIQSHYRFLRYNAKAASCMSKQERVFHADFTKLCDEHINTMVMMETDDNFKGIQKNPALKTDPEKIDPVFEMNRFVFARAKTDIPELAGETGSGSIDNGAVICGRYRSLADHLKSKHLELI
ncbi:DNA replication complex GINS protein SLD5 [Monocercomonoides exilis]|uniref:DNA replication complex GINS protein SLD5 n=1 Tax=Monocercomonoides exilis TaxID=2049356 RepID=UPI00355965B2|nr:DNA replication complex GINS protein SLD5 [Monocercomonoides exilis]|eukprot:MONOS_3595.1-p1 / transcript=MONOS_3595.1 / gene=MONOS_3595 / organism=Monocercomonoides_exilis_PA203 / gene_product=DNA replication complex GINS protein SLD5 / transcript_product=DNA replication complex GINS protein SLD5 / location=Mono_scaffold00086:22809-23633(+) / protein_length=243 / sequence_SO=supercontig / SO=protein_coding / is_pseudo=false